MQEESNSLKPYSYIEKISSNFATYSFVTDLSIEYSVYFTDGSGYFPKYPDFCNNIVMLGFELKSQSENMTKKLDSRISDTIFSIIKESTFPYPDRSLLIICDMSDGKHAYRNALFERWYKQLKDKEIFQFSKYNLRICNSENNCAFLSILIPTNCYYHEDAKNAFLDFDNELIAKGY